MSGATVTGPAIPAGLGKYEIRGLLGRGAMGVVYDGWDPVIDRRIAIKTVSRLPADDEAGAEALARFRREAQAAGRLHHPNIVAVFDYGETDDLAYIVMEFVEGKTLKDMVAGDERMSPADTIRVMTDILAGLDYSHERGVVHRDIKPANIILTASGQAKIADFGIARIESSSMTQAGMVMGTPAYMSPEQFMGNVVDRRTDIYSCGVVLYQLLAGERPFDGNMSSIMHKVMTTTPPRPSALTVTAPRALDAVVAKAMAVRPEDRYPTAPAFAEALRAPPPPVEAADEDATVLAPRAASKPVPPPAPPPAIPPPAKPSSRMGLAIAAVVLLLAGGGGAAWLFLGQKPEPQPAPSQTASIPATPERAKPPQPAPEAPKIAAPPAEAPKVAIPPAEAPKVASAPPETLAATPAPGPTPTPSQTASIPPPQPATPVPPPRPSAPVEAMNTAPPPVAPPETSPLKVAPPAAPPAAPVRSPAEIASTLATSVAGVPCSLPRVGNGPGGVTLSGLAGAGDPVNALRKAAAAADPSRVAWQVRSVDGPFCTTLDLLRSVPETASSAVSLEQEGGASPLVDEQVIGLRVTMPGFGGYLHMAYVQSNATVSLLVPSTDYPAQTYAARTAIALGQPRGSFPGWRAGPPFGTDMVVAVVSSAPLFARPPTDEQPLGTYLSSLGTAIQALRRQGGSVAATATIIETKPGPTAPAK